jgi:hypothetical protein
LEKKLAEVSAFIQNQIAVAPYPVMRLPPAIVPTRLLSAQPVKSTDVPTTAVTDIFMRRPKEEGPLRMAAIPSMKSSLILHRASSAEDTDAASDDFTACKLFTSFELTIQ